MADFPGVNYRSGLVGEAFSELINVSHVDEDVLRRRPGFVPLATPAAISGATGIAFNGTALVQDAASGTIKAVTLSTGSVGSALVSSLGSATGCFAKHNGRVYWTRGDLGPYVFDTATSSARTPGIPAPAGTIGSPSPTASTGVITTGSHIFRYRYKNSTTGYVSDPSGAATITVATPNNTIAFVVGTHIVTSGTSGVDKIVLEMTTSGGAAFYQAYEVANSAGTITVTYSDAQLTARPPSALFGDNGHGAMPTLDLITEHRNRLVGVQRSTRLLAWSQAGYPEAWDLTLNSRRLSTIETTDTATALVSFSGDLYVMQNYGMSRLSYIDDPSAGVLLSIPTDEGCWNQRCWVMVANQLFGFGPAGIWTISALSPTHISREVDPFIEASIDITQSDKFFCWYSVEDRSITFAFVATGDTGCRTAVTYSLRSGAWSTRTYDHIITGAVAAYNKLYLMTSTPANFWQERSGTFDGVSTATAFTVSTAAGSTVTISSTMTASAYVGRYLRFGSEVRYITANTTTQFTLSSGFTTTPVLGSVVRVGSISVTLTSDWIRQDTMARVTSPVYLGVEMEPAQSTETHSVQVYLNFSDTPIPWTFGESDTPPSGVTYSNAATALSVQADGGNGAGFVPVPMPSDWARVVRFKLTSTGVAAPFGIISLNLIDRDAAKSLPAVQE